MLRVLIRKIPRKSLQLYFVDPATGKEKTRSAGTADRGQAERAAANWERELLEFRGSDDAGWQWFRKRFADEHLVALSPKGAKIYRTALRSFEKYFTLSSVADVTASHISQFQSELIQANRPLTTVATYLAHLRGALNWAERMGMIRKAPRVVLPKMNKRKLSKGRAITEAEYRKMLGKAGPLKSTLELLWLSGLRINEALALSWDSPPVQILLDAKPHPYILFHAEGQKSRQDAACPITRDLAAWLGKVPKAKRKGFVLPAEGNRGRFQVRTISERISNIGKAAGVYVTTKKPASAHDLRRSYGTRWASKVRPLTLQRMMRHSTLETTMKFYISLSSADVGAELWD